MPCPAWGSQERYVADTYAVPIAAQIQQLDLSTATVASIANALSAPPSLPDDIGRKRIQREREQAAAAFSRKAITLADFMAKLQTLDEQETALTTRQEGPQVHMTPGRAIGYLRDFADAWSKADERARADMAHATYERIEVDGSRFVSVTLTPDAERHGVAVALPERPNVGSISRLLWRPRQDSNLRPTA